MMRSASSAVSLRLLAAGLSLALGACAARQPVSQPSPQTPPPLEKITTAVIHVSRSGDLSPVIGREQQYRIVSKDTLLDVARNAGLGFQEIKDANRDVDEWVPPPGRVVDVPTRWILPQAPQEGIVVNIPEMRLYYYPQRTRPG